MKIGGNFLSNIGWTQTTTRYNVPDFCARSGGIQFFTAFTYIELNANATATAQISLRDSSDNILLTWNVTVSGHWMVEDEPQPTITSFVTNNNGAAVLPTGNTADISGAFDSLAYAWARADYVPSGSKVSLRAHSDVFLVPVPLGSYVQLDSVSLEGFTDDGPGGFYRPIMGINARVACRPKAIWTTAVDDFTVSTDAHAAVPCAHYYQSSAGFDGVPVTDPAAHIVSYQWAWAAPPTYTDTGVTATHEYDDGSYSVYLKVTDNYGGWDERLHVVTVDAGKKTSVILLPTGDLLSAAVSGSTVAVARIPSGISSRQSLTAISDARCPTLSYDAFSGVRLMVQRVTTGDAVLYHSEDFGRSFA